MTYYSKITATLGLILLIFVMLPASALAQSSEEKRVEFFSENAIMEDDPNAGQYNITIYSPDGQWKMQLNYFSSSMFGTFTNDDFHLSTTGKNYNYVRNPKNDMVFYSFTDMNVTVSDEGTVYRVQANCLTNNKMRFVVEANIPAPVAERTVSDDLGYARLEQNTFYGTWAVYSENANFKLGYGVVSNSVLGTFYRADILLPELYDKKAGKDISVVYATAVHRKDGDNTLLHIDIISEDHVQYSLDMFNGPYNIEITEEKDITIGGMILQDLTDMYGCYQFGGASTEWGLAVAVKPEALSSGRKTWTRDDMIMQFTRLVTMPDQKAVEIFDIKATLVSENGETKLLADITAMDGILYHVTMTNQEIAPDPTQTVNIDFGKVAVLDYTQGTGITGIGAVKQGQYQLRYYFVGHNLDGEYGNDVAILDMCDIMVVDPDKGTYVFHDAKYVTSKMETKNGTTHITVDMIGVDDVLYHATMTLEDMECLHDMTLQIGMDDAQMIALREGTDGLSSEYTLQLQNMDNVYDEDYNIVGDGYALSFYFSHVGTAAVAGEYGYSAGTLAEDEPHTFFENGCEVRVGAVAGTLNLVPVQKGTVKIDLQTITTYLYQIKAEFVGQNGAIYTAQGDNVLICLDADGNLMSMDEPTYTGITDVLAKEGYQVRKVLKDGKLLIQKNNKSYNLQGSPDTL